MSSERGSFGQRLSQLRTIFTATREADPRFVPLLAGAIVLPLIAGLAVGIATGNLLVWLPLGLLVGLAGALILFGRRAAAAQLSAIEGKPGAAAAVLQAMRGGWRVTPAVAFTRKQDLVHRVVGRPGVILVGEGSPARVTSLLRQEHRKLTRVVGEIPVHQVNVGTGKGQVPLPKLQGQLARLPRALKRGDIPGLERRLASLNDTDLPIPKGPMPRAPRGKRR